MFSSRNDRDLALSVEMWMMMKHEDDDNDDEHDDDEDDNDDNEKLVDIFLSFP